MKYNIIVIGSTGQLGSKLLNYAYKNNIEISVATCLKILKNYNYKNLNTKFRKLLFFQKATIKINF